MTEDEKRIEQEAIKFATKNHAIANELTAEKDSPEDEPVAVSMAGSLALGNRNLQRVSARS